MITSATCTRVFQRVEIFRKGRIFVLRMRRRWLESKVQMVAFIVEVAAEEMEIDGDGEGAGVARAEARADELGDEPPPPRPREVRPSATCHRRTASKLGAAW